MYDLHQTVCISEGQSREAPAVQGRNASRWLAGPRCGSDGNAVQADVGDAARVILHVAVAEPIIQQVGLQTPSVGDSTSAGFSASAVST